MTPTKSRSKMPLIQETPEAPRQPDALIVFVVGRVFTVFGAHRLPDCWKYSKCVNYLVADLPGYLDWCVRKGFTVHSAPTTDRQPIKSMVVLCGNVPLGTVMEGYNSVVKSLLKLMADKLAVKNG